eukprot:g37031.t1
MSGSKPDILWAPHHVDRFVVCDSELCLYRTESVGNCEAKAGSLRLSEDTTATLLAINSDTPYMKCVAWYPKYDPECLLAVGQANGRVVLTSLGQDRNSKCRDLIGKEFVPKHARQCNTLAWNPVDSNWLAAGLDKHRADFSVLIWDISSKYTPEIAVPAEKVRLSAGDTDAGLNRMVVVTPNRLMSDFTVFERISLAWSPTTSLMWACGRHLYNCSEEGEASSGEKDVATKMRQRALSRYGLDTEQVWRNHLLAGDDDPQLKSL